jgi:hypothetical protein
MNGYYKLQKIYWIRFYHKKKKKNFKKEMVILDYIQIHLKVHFDGLGLWTNWRCSWYYLSNIIMIMVEFEAKTKFTSPYTINETFFKRMITCAQVLKKNLPIPCEERKTLSKGKRLWFVPWTIRNSYICFTKPCIYTTTTTIHVTTYCTSQVTNFSMES